MARVDVQSARRTIDAAQRSRYCALGNFGNICIGLLSMSFLLGFSMRIFVLLLIFCVLGVPLALVGAVVLAVADQPTVSRAAEFTPEDIARAKRIVEQNDPRNMKAGGRRTLSLSQEDVDLALNYLAGRYAKGSSRVELQAGAASISASLELPAKLPGRYLNVAAVLHETAALPEFDSLRVGRLPVPAWLANTLLGMALKRLDQRANFRIVRDTLKQITVSQGRINVTYDWQQDLPDRIKAVMLPPDDLARLQAYQTQLAAISTPAAGSVSLSNLITPLFKLAAQRSASGDPAAENRAAIVVLTFYINGKGLEAIVPAARDWPRAVTRKVLLSGRDDFAQHFSISAALAANAGAAISDVIGLYKEVSDSRGGSGFSFNDIAADKAGSRFGELAVASRESALKLQRMVNADVTDKDLMPPFADLPEFMPEAEFKRRYGGIGAPAYKTMMDDIERRVAALPLFR